MIPPTTSPISVRKSAVESRGTVKYVTLKIGYKWEQGYGSAEEKEESEAPKSTVG